MMSRSKTLLRESYPSAQRTVSDVVNVLEPPALTLPPFAHVTTPALCEPVEPMGLEPEDTYVTSAAGRVTATELLWIWSPDLLDSV